MSKRHWPAATPPVYGLGPPINRADENAPPKRTPIPGRPNWFRVAGSDRPIYVEPPRPVIVL